MPRKRYSVVGGWVAACNRCNEYRPQGVHPCPFCKCPEYRIIEGLVSLDRKRDLKGQMLLFYPGERRR